MTCRERTPVENLKAGDVVQAVPWGPKGVVVDNDEQGSTVVRYRVGRGLMEGDHLMRYRHRDESLYFVEPPNDEPSGTDSHAEELALRLADAMDVLESIKAGQIPSDTSTTMWALDYALRGHRGLETPEEFQERRREALARHGTYLGLSDPE